MRQLLIVASALSVIGCGAGCAASDSAGRSSTTATAPSTEIKNETSSLPDSNDPRPLLTMSSWPYLEFGDSRPRDLPFFVVYPNGETLVFGFPGAPEHRTASDDELAALLDAAESAGLVGGGMQSFLEEEPPETIDGGQGVFTFRVGETLTTRVVDQPSSGGSTEREAFRRILEGLQAIGDDTAPARLLVDDWAVTRRAFDPATDWDSNRTSWGGPALADMSWETVDGVECAIIRDLDWPYDDEELGDARYMADGTVTTRRPLLPHESDCSDVFEFRTALGL